MPGLRHGVGVFGGDHCGVGFEFVAQGVVVAVEELIEVGVEGWAMVGVDGVCEFVEDDEVDESVGEFH